MMKKLICVILVVNSLFITAQEELQPLKYNSKLTSNIKEEKSSALNETFIYLIDTLSLPVIDDFSRDHFKKFEADTADANVSDTTWFALVNTGVPEPMGTEYMLDTSYRYEYDTVPGSGFDSITIDTIAFLPITIDVYDLSVYPIIMTTEEVWPATYFIDSLWTATVNDDTIYESNPDLVQDSVIIYFVFPTAEDSELYWQDNYAYRNNTLAIDPITIGVATMDGLDENGYPYDWSSASAHGIADYLTSKPISMGAHSPADSIYLSFLYQAGGKGEAPDVKDSLVLEFWSPSAAEWRSIWNAPGTTTTTFQTAMIPITNTDYFSDGFQFRFKNYGSLTGSLDHWHIDYVLLDDLRSKDDFEMNDWAFQYEAPSLIETYTSMPWSHYQTVPHTMMKTETSVETYNSLNSSKIIEAAFCNMDLFYEGSNLETIPYINVTGNTPALSSLNMDYAIPSTFWFDTAMADTLASFDIRYTLSTSTLPERLNVNDTLWQTQLFDNYYSYDDGTAEAAYGLVGNGAELAYQFTMPAGLTDTLRAIKMYFAATVNDASLEPFFLQVWNDINGEPGDVIYTTNDDDVPLTYTPIYNAGVDALWEYVLPETVLVSGTYYVGWKQTTSERLNIGFDNNINNQDKIFYDLGSGWANTGFEGSLMIRPVFTSKKDALFVSMKEKSKKLSFAMYPNPANDQLNVFVGDGFRGELELYDLQGRLMLIESFDTETSINILDIPCGLYVVRLIDEFGNVVSDKLSVSR